MPMPASVFYSWQSDLPNAANRGFIEHALGRAVDAVGAAESLAVDPVVDRDTAGLPGAPDIAASIFEKVACAAVFVADVSIINGPPAPGRRPTPNPNVLVELGYALHVLGPARVLLVLNAEYGGPDLLPFDLRPRRTITYRMAERALSRAGERKKLEAALTGALHTILTAGTRAPIALAAISGQRGQRMAVAIRLLEQGRIPGAYPVSRVAELLGLAYANELEHYVDGTAEPPLALLDRFADHFGASAEWLKHGRGAPFTSTEGYGTPRACLERVRALAPQRVFFVRSTAPRGESGVVVKISGDKYLAFPTTWVISGDVGGGGRALILEFYHLVSKLRRERGMDVAGRQYDPALFTALMHGELWPGYVDKGGSFAAAWWDDFADAESPHFSDEQLGKMWGQGLVDAASIVRGSLRPPSER